MMSISITGPAKTKLGKLLKADDLKVPLQKGLQAAALVLEGYIKPYPGAPSGKSWTYRGGQQGRAWYERGWGSKWTALDSGAGGGIKGKKSFKPSKGVVIRGRKTSEMLGRAWSIQPDQDDGTAVHILNRASYLKWVHQARTQTRVHASNNWKTDEKGAEWLINSGRFGSIMAQAVKAYIGGKL